ncbi:hypothetical protein [Agrobacterium rosae]|uniref:hypothetical protein n=1 Tax=Agrobacterium rosae TaxID=1972867 RepID=UPI003B9DDFA1
MIHIVENYLFDEGFIEDLLDEHRHKIRSQAKSIAYEDLVSTPEDTLVDTLVGGNAVDIPSLDRASISVLVGEGDVPYEDEANFCGYSFVDGIRFEVEIPFSGDSRLFRFAPDNNTPRSPSGYIRASSVVVTIMTDDGRQALEPTILRIVDEISQNLSGLREKTKGLAEELSEIAKEVIRKRKTDLGFARASVAKMGFVLRTQSELSLCEVPLERTSIIEDVSATGERDTLPPSEYDNIIRIISHMTKVMERSPSAFHNMKEEFVRDFYLVFLNGHYEGRATGETFNAGGKTDILVRENDENIFIAECKFWKGKASFIRAINQIMKYLSWRDGKAALVILNRNKNSTVVCKQIANVTPTHPQYLRRVPGHDKEAEFRCFFAREGDAGAEILLSILVFDVPSAPKHQVLRRHNAPRRNSSKQIKPK